MALIAHYPLNGDTKDYSGYGNDGVSTGAVVSNTGKIGGSYKFDGVTSGVNIPSVNYIGMEVYSMAAWVKPLGNHKNYNGAVISSGNWSSSAWNFGLSQDNSKIDVASNRYNRYLDYPVPVGEWTHIVCVAENNVTKVYVNGNYVGQVNAESKLTSNAANTYIGRETYASGYFAFNGELNDIRIYDHALSDKEVKELAKAKVLHYKFDPHETTTTNIFDFDVNSRCWDGGGGSVCSLRTVTSKNSMKFVGRSNLHSSSGYAYTYPLFPTTNDIHTFSMVVTNKGDKPVRFDAKLRNGSNGTDLGGGVVVSIGSGETARVVTTSISPVSSDLITTAISSYSDTDGNINIEVSEIQLEVGSVATGVVVGTRSSSTVKDSSGFGNDGSVAATTAPSWSEDSPVGRGSMEFSGAKFITLPNMLGSDEQITVCAWFKSNGLGGSGYHIIFGGREVELDVTSAGKARFGLIIDNVRKFHNYSSGLADGKYHHICGVYDGAVKVVYVDGVIVGSYPVVGKIKNNFTNRRVGVFGASTYYHANGNISDVRIYATALSPEDILELYQTRASVDNEGNLFVQEIDEINNTSKEVDSRGIARFTEFNEVGGENKMSIKNDGVVYVNEIMEA